MAHILQRRLLVCLALLLSTFDAADELTRFFFRCALSANENNRILDSNVVYVLYKCDVDRLSLVLWVLWLLWLVRDLCVVWISVVWVWV